MKLAKKFSLAAIVVAAGVLLAACQTTRSNTLVFTPPAPTATMTSSNQKAVVNVVGKDDRSNPSIATYKVNDGLFSLSASPDVATLFKQVLQQDLNAKGFHVGSVSAANTNVVVMVQQFYANVEEGNLRHKITSKIQLAIHVQGAKGNFTKNIGSTRTDEGAFTVNNADIQKSLDAVLKEVVSAIYKDQEIANAIRQYAN
ncbi:YajG family lipoprotein [Pasteurellaceae bacterium LIM206]|nr:YajG family lipoprotein [Pasteurellaceae bacterium LIM206]